MHCTIYYVVNGESSKDAENTLEHRLNEDGTEDNWFSLVACIRQDNLELKCLNKHDYDDSDFTIDTILNRINEDTDLDTPINEETLWSYESKEDIWDEQSLTNETTRDYDKYLFIVNIHT